MGSLQRVNEIVDGIKGAVWKKATSKAFKDCGNCAMKFKCASKRIDLKQAVEVLLWDGWPLKEIRRPSMAAKAAAKVFTERCRVCPHLMITCIPQWLTDNEMQSLTDKVTRKVELVKTMDEADVAKLFDIILRMQNLTAMKLLTGTLAMWEECEREGYYVTTTEVFCMQDANK